MSLPELTDDAIRKAWATVEPDWPLQATGFKFAHAIESALKSQLVEAQKDALRYQQLRQRYSGLFCSAGKSGPRVSFMSTLDQPEQFPPSLLDTAIDAAMGKSEAAEQPSDRDSSSDDLTDAALQAVRRPVRGTEQP